MKTIAVYAASSTDYVDGEERLGGPLVYAEKALELVGAGAEAVPVDASPECHAVFHHSEVAGWRRSRLLRKPSCRVNAVHADAALFSPIAGEYGYDDLLRVRPLHPIMLVDFQGLMRVFDAEGWVHPPSGTELPPPPGGWGGLTLYRASIEDVGSLHRSLLWAEAAEGEADCVIVSMGQAGALMLCGASGLYICRPRRVAAGPAIGAGDMLGALMLYGLLEGLEPGRTLCSAVSGVACILAGGRSCGKAFREGYLAELVAWASTRSPALFHHHLHRS